jgi:hypothetical protein
MQTTQYTIRNIPEPVNRYLRKKARLSGKSLNQVIVDELSEKVADPSATVGPALSWFIGSGMDDATLLALDEQDKLQKKLAAKDL